ncbi:MAG: ABC transporter permease [Phycisphaerae bacterium]|nr:ABC transporter permease [Phycisphaerae bacterium]
MAHDKHTPFPWPLLRFWTRQTFPTWFGMAGVIFLFQIAVCTIVHDDNRVQAFLQLLKFLPPFIKSMLGGETLQAGNISGLIAIGYNHPLVMILYMLYAVGVPTSLLAGEVQRGTMELILSRQTTKTQVYTCVGLITVIGMFAMVLVMFLGTTAGTHMYTFKQDVPLDDFFKIAINGGLMASAVGGIALLAAACFRRPVAVSVTVTYLVLMYFTSFVSEWWPRLAFLSPATLFHYINGFDIFVKHVWPVRDMAVLVTVMIAATVLGGIVWQRRDLSV